MDRAEFDKFADEYTAMHAASIAMSGEAPEYFARYKIDDVASEFGKLGRVPSRILDFGAGVGNSLGPLREHFPECEIVLLDPSHRSLELARQRFPEMATFQEFDGRRIPYPDETFELIFTACVFHHIDAREHVRLFREIQRVLAPGGSFFIFEHNPFNPLTRKAVRDCPFDENAVLISPIEMRKRLSSSGLRMRKTAYRLFFPRFLKALRPLESLLTWLPLGAQYFVHATKGTEPSSA